MGVLVNGSDGFTFNQLKDAVRSGRLVILCYDDYAEGVTGSIRLQYLCYLDYSYTDELYTAKFMYVSGEYGSEPYPVLMFYQASDPDENMYQPD